MHHNPYFLEKSMEVHSRNVEKESRKWWRYRKDKEQAEPAPTFPSQFSAPNRDTRNSNHNLELSLDRDPTVTSQTYTSSQA